MASAVDSQLVPLVSGCPTCPTKTLVENISIVYVVPMPDHPFQPFGGYENLKSYAYAEAIYEATTLFCERFYANNFRMTDQMVQAARSGVRNLSEASGAAATSKKSEMSLTNVARASLRDELLRDFESFMCQRDLPIWHKEDPRTLEMRKRLYHDRAPWVQEVEGKVVLTGLKGLADFVREADPELAGNAMLCALHQASWLILRQLQGQMRQFEQDGGFSENLSRRRRKRWDK